MSSENIIGVCVSRDTSNISVFNVSRTDDKVENIKLIHYDVINKPMHDVAICIKQISDSFLPSLCIVENYGAGIFISDELKMDDNFTVPVLCIKQPLQNQSDIKLVFEDLYSSGKLINFEKYFNRDLIDKYLLGYSRIADDKTCRFKSIKDIAFLIFNIMTCKEQYKKQERNNKIESNLTEIINICMETLKETDISDKNKLYKLIHLVDKANYMRGQYINL